MRRRNPKPGSKKRDRGSMPTVGMSIEGKHPKTAVSQFLERYLSRAFTKEDIRYDNRQAMSGRVCTTLTVPCFNFHQYFGEADTSEESEKLAAARFLQDPDVQDALKNLAPSCSKVRRWEQKRNPRQGIDVHAAHCSWAEFYKSRSAIRDGRA